MHVFVFADFKPRRAPFLASLAWVCLISQKHEWPARPPKRMVWPTIKIIPHTAVCCQVDKVTAWVCLWYPPRVPIPAQPCANRFLEADCAPRTVRFSI